MKKILSNKYVSALFVLIIYFLFFIVVYNNVLSNDTLLVKSDGLLTYFKKWFSTDALKNGELPLWNPYIGIGLPYLSDVQNTFFSLENILYLIFGVTLGYNLLHVVQLSFAAFFMYLFINKKFQSNCVAFLVGLIFACSTMINGVRIEHSTIITTIILYPLIFYFFECFKNSKHEKYVYFSSICMGIQFLSGFTQIVLYFDIICFIYFIFILKDLQYNVKQSVLIIFKWGISYLLLICIQLIPTIQLMFSSQKNEVSFEYFSYLSYDLKIIFMMLFPGAVSDVYQPFGYTASSGIDIEIYLGIALTLFLFYVIRYRFKDKFVQRSIVLMLITFFFGMAGNIPVLGAIIYKTPLLGSFRVCSRSLNIFIFMELVVVAYAFTLLKDKEVAKSCVKFAIKYYCYLLVSILLIYCYSSQVLISDTGIDYKKLLVDYVANMILVLTLLKLISLERSKELHYKVLLTILVVFSISNVWKYSNAANVKSVVDNRNINSLSDELKELIEENSEESYRSFATIKDAIELEDDQLRIAKYNSNLQSKDLMYNSYVTFLDRKLNQYGIAETNFYPEFINKLYSRNDLVSMLSIRYIFDAWENFENDPYNELSNANTMYGDSFVDNVEDLVFINDITIGSKGEIDTYYDEISLENNSQYLISFSLNGCSPETLLYVDFYNVNYDNAEQDGIFQQSCFEDGKFSTIISTDEIPDDITYFRIITDSQSELAIHEFKIQKIEKNAMYDEIYNDGEVKVYSNPKAKQLLYASKYVEPITDLTILYEGSNEKRLDECSYLESSIDTMDLSSVSTKITDIVVDCNSVSAVVTCDNTTFINHTQLYYPGWKAYIDGDSVPLYEVNGLIQGIYVPEGTHNIEFRFEPTVFYYGFVLLLIGLILIILFFISAKHKFGKNQIQKGK